MPAPDWAQKMLSFREFEHDGYCLDHGLSGSCTKEMHAKFVKGIPPALEDGSFFRWEQAELNRA